MSFFVEGQVEIRVIQIALPDRPLCLHCLFPFDGVEAAGALSVHQCVCPQCHPDLVAVRTYRHLTSQEMTSLCVIIVKNKCLDMLRVSKSGLQSDLEKVDYALHDEKDQPLENVIQEEGEKELLEAMKILPEKLRLVLELRYFHEYSNGEIAKILDISKKNVEIRLYRAKKKMKEVLQYERERQEI